MKLLVSSSRIETKSFSSLREKFVFCVFYNLFVSTSKFPSSDSTLGGDISLVVNIIDELGLLFRLVLVVTGTT